MGKLNLYSYWINAKKRFKELEKRYDKASPEVQEKIDKILIDAANQLFAKTDHLLTK